MSDELSPRERDISNMGRCVACGKPVDMRDEGDDLVVMEQEEIDDPGIDENDVRDAMARALRRSENPEDYAIADAYEERKEIVLHSDCYDKSALSEFPMEEA